MILDLGLPDADGLTVLREIRGWSSVPVLVLSVRADEAGKVAALDCGRAGLRCQALRHERTSRPHSEPSARPGQCFDSGSYRDLRPADRFRQPHGVKVGPAPAPDAAGVRPALASCQPRGQTGHASHDPEIALGSGPLPRTASICGSMCASFAKSSATTLQIHTTSRPSRGSVTGFWVESACSAVAREWPQGLVSAGMARELQRND